MSRLGLKDFETSSLFIALWSAIRCAELLLFLVKSRVLSLLVFKLDKNFCSGNERYHSKFEDLKFKFVPTTCEKIHLKHKN